MATAAWIAARWKIAETFTAGLPNDIAAQIVKIMIRGLVESFHNAVSGRRGSAESGTIVFVTDNAILDRSSVGVAVKTGRVGLRVSVGCLIAEAVGQQQVAAGGTTAGSGLSPTDGGMLFMTVRAVANRVGCGHC